MTAVPPDVVGVAAGDGGEDSDEEDPPWSDMIQVRLKVLLRSSVLPGTLTAEGQDKDNYDGRIGSIYCSLFLTVNGMLK